MRRRTGVIAAVCVAVVVTAQAQTTVDPSGHWEGTVDLPNFKLQLAVDIARGETSGFVGTLTNESRDIHGLPLKSVSVDGRLVQIVVVSGSGREEFSGVLTADGKTISGSFNVNGFSAPIDFTRTGEPRIDRPSSPAIGAPFEGTWNGVLDVNGTQMRVVLKMTNHSNGTSTGVVVNLDSGGVEIPVSRLIQNAANLTAEVKVVGGMYVGTLTADGSELAGTWTQPAFSAPLTFRRASR